MPKSEFSEEISTDVELTFDADGLGIPFVARSTRTDWSMVVDAALGIDAASVTGAGIPALLIDARQVSGTVRILRALGFRNCVGYT